MKNMKKMKKKKVLRRLRRCLHPPVMCRLDMTCLPYALYTFPLRVTDKFLLAAVEDDFLLDGWCIRRVKQVRHAEVYDNKFLDIERAEGLVDRIAMPPVNLSNWRQIFLSLRSMNRLIIIEHESLRDDECDFYMGRIEDIKKHSVLFRCVNTDATWDDEPIRIAFRDITSVSFGSRYIEVFSKYVPKY